MDKICTFCGYKYSANSPNQKSCDKCRTKICVTCGKSYKTSTTHITESKYCCHECFLKSRYNKDNKCRTCGEPSKYTYCSNKCRDRYWEEKNKEFANRHKIQYWKERLELISLLGGKCLLCGNDDIRCLDIHHKDGSKKVIPPKRHYNFSNRLKDWKENFGNLELLCANCHRIITWKEQKYKGGI